MIPLCVVYLSELKVLDDGLDFLGLAVLQVEDGALPALARVPLRRRRPPWWQFNSIFWNEFLNEF